MLKHIEKFPICFSSRKTAYIIARKT